MDIPANYGIEEVFCELCGSHEYKHIADSQDVWHGLQGTFPIVRCLQCGLIYLTPRPSAQSIGYFYPNDYYAFEAVDVSKDGGTVRNRIRRYIRRHRSIFQVARHIPALRGRIVDTPLEDDLPHWVKPSGVLDVGCGSGAFLDAMADLGWVTWGVEPDVHAARVAQMRGHRVFCQTANDPLPQVLFEGQISVIHCSHSLEHMHHPKDALTALRKILDKSSGFLVIEVPNVDALLARLFFLASPAVDSPRHLYLFSPKTLRELLITSGYDVVNMRVKSQPGQVLKSLSMLQKSMGVDWGFDEEDILPDFELSKVISSISELAVDRDQGGAIRVVATPAGQNV